MRVSTAHAHVRNPRVLAMLGARGSIDLNEVRDSGVAVAPASSEGGLQVHRIGQGVPFSVIEVRRLV